MNISGGEVTSAAGDANLFSAETQTPTDLSQSAQSLNESNATNPDNQNAQKNSDADSKTPEDIMEKYLMIIRALEDEWANFTDSKEYKNLPEHTIDEATTSANKKTRRLLDAPNRKFLAAANFYREAMMFRN